MSAIEVRNVFKVFGARETEAMKMLSTGADKKSVLERTGCNVGIHDVSLSIEAGEIFVIMGLSGSGKSTLVRHFNRLIEPSAGEILVGSRDVIQLDDAGLRQLRRNDMSMVFQNFGLLPHKTVIDNVGYGLVVRGEKSDAVRATACRWIERVGLKGYESKYPDELSGGMRQRVGLARALTVDASILLMDEAFSALDPLIRHDMQDLLLDLQGTLKKTIVFITHDIDEALRIGARIAIMRDGRLIQVGTPTEILESPADDYVRRFVDKRVETPMH
ncbi:MAG: betaine/proline/choline family ABC transporter ATP-binding protein [Rhodoferax sp.]|uniref:quaternary amine ABC transporter ATP-binding protein n=1 Tax=Rhodoferax sp. TaxID=50421 RepID=UPI003267A41F